MGNLLRCFWQPFALASELPGADCDPLRVRLLGEDLVAFRDTNAAVGLVQNNCPHRGASLFFGRNEESGLRCVYHGWKFDTSGACVDVPGEPAESDLRSRVRALTYPVREHGGVLWAYLGPAPARRRRVVADGRGGRQGVLSTPPPGLWEVGATPWGCPRPVVRPREGERGPEERRGRGLSTGRRFPQPFVARGDGRAGAALS